MRCDGRNDKPELDVTDINLHEESREEVLRELGIMEGKVSVS